MLNTPAPAELSAHALNNHINKEKEQRKKIKAAKELVEQRILQRKAVYRDDGPEVHDDSISSKLTRQGDYDGPTLVGEMLATFFMHLFQTIFATQYLIQQREFSEAQELDRVKEQMIESGQATDDGVRLAYQPVPDKNGNLVWPAVYPIQNGQVNYHAKPNTDGTASRFAIRMNGFVPKEDFAESYEIQMLKFSKDFAGSSSFTPSQRAKVRCDEGHGPANRDDANTVKAATSRPRVRA